MSEEVHSPPKKDGIFGVGEGLSTGILVAIPSVHSLELQTPVSHHTTLVLYALPVLEIRLSGCKQNFVYLAL